MSKSQKDLNIVTHTTELNPKLLTDVRKSIVVIRDIPVIADADVASLYGVETKRVNEAVRNNPDKFPEDYMFVLSSEESDVLRSKFSTTNISSKSRVLPAAFFQKQGTSQGLYRERVVYACHNLEEQERTKCHICYY